MVAVNDVNFANCYFTGSLKVKTFLAGSFREQVKEIYVCGRERNRFELKNWVCCTLKRKFVAHSLKNSPTNGCFKSALTPKLISNKKISDLSFQKRNSSQKNTHVQVQLNCLWAISSLKLVRCFISRKIKLCLFKAFAWNSELEPGIGADKCFL